jgi:hypothetical protein
MAPTSHGPTVSLPPPTAPPPVTADGAAAGVPRAVEHVPTGDADPKVLRDRPGLREWAAALKPAKGQ